VWKRTDEKYEGEWQGDERNGFGTHIWHDGTKYTGEFRSNKLEGAGMYMWPDGRVRLPLRPSSVRLSHGLWAALHRW
jgi:hypothetical protein